MPHRNPSVPPQLVPLDDVDLYARALALSAGPKKAPVHERVLNVIYWGGVLILVAWFLAMASDRSPPIRWVSREIVNPDGKVRQGERVQVKAVRVRTRICELVKRQSLIDGSGRRTDYEAERFDAYGAITGPTSPETDITGPTVPLDAVPGRGRLVTAFAWDCNVLQRALGWSITEVQGPLEFEIVAR
ncbi:MAG: hypothetical protein K2Y56_17235 [Methylobacterium sp.]|uniref:hypothetical protein n=1 Tax=Methylobacterium sp. TaxID=409 RepID=UPI0025F9EE14|nr:hypothetical protein [Methylobacterium sp.]MBX9933250.1 hypothetical protein [Methylobacterium sp.]